MKKILFILLLMPLLASAQWDGYITNSLWFKEDGDAQGGDIGVSDTIYTGWTGASWSTIIVNGRIIKYDGSTPADGDVLQASGGEFFMGAPAFLAGAVTGLNPDQGLYGAADGSIAQDDEWTYDDVNDAHQILSDEADAGFNVLTTDFSIYASLKASGLGLQGVSHASNFTSDEIASYTAVHQFLQITPDPGAWDGYTNITTAGTDDVINWVLPAAQGAANTFLKNDGSGNISWSAEPSLGTVTSFTFTDGGGFDGTVTNSTTTPTLSIIPSFTGLAYSDGSALAAVTVNSPLAFSTGSLSLSDGDHGDITTSSSGSVWTVDNLAITDAKINDVAIGKVTGLGSGINTWLVTPSSANLATAITDETGTGALVFANTPTLVTPVLGVATATSISNATANNSKLTLGANGFQMVRNVADGNTLLELNQASASSTGRLIDAQLNGTTMFQVQYTGSTVVNKTSNDATHALKVSQSHASATGTIFTGANNTGDVFTITQAGKVGLYNGITTANNGALTSVGTPVHLTGQTANIGATSCYTTTADGFYSIYWNAAITTAATTGAATATLGHFQIQYTNVADNIVKTTPTANNVTASAANVTTGTGSGIGGVITVYAKSGTNINYIMGYTSNTAAQMQYSLDITVVKL